MSDGVSARYTYRLRVCVTAERSLNAEWDRCRWVWNQCVAESRAAHKVGEPCGPAALDKMLTGWRAEHEWLRDGASVPQQQIIRDFGKSRAKALKDIKNRVAMQLRAGMPRFKKRGLDGPTLNYTKRGFRIHDGGLHLAGGSVVSVVWSRELPAEPSSVRVYRDNLGHWYASFVVRTSIEPLSMTGRSIGIDWGVKEIGTTTSGQHDLPHPEYGKKAAANLVRYQRMMARRRPAKGAPPSKRYRDAKCQNAKAHAKIVRQRRDNARKWAKAVVRDFDQIAVEDFRPKFLAKSTMARKAADGAIGATKAALIEMGRKHGRDVRLVPAANTTTDCSDCGARTKLPLSQRIYTCTACGFEAPRDKNSALVVLRRAGFTPAGAEGARPDRTPCGQAA
ncbi:RNA-guided endonuclease InsQ/TnpB family protein [Nocardia tengchongensis]|uniref:RNA-guided endonuclease InsQ/TnpB family protein n=1 Tax=Nocardia tengchongensis TaxID=2055889 RepID=UPI0036B3A000